VPSQLDWDLWLGPAPVRPYKAKHIDGPFAGKPVYHPFVWRGWWDFGTGALGDMGCHEINMVYMGLDLRNPLSVQATTSGHNRDSLPAWSIVTYEFAATPQRPALKMVWYDGGKKPAQELLGDEKVGNTGSVIVGEKGKFVGGSREIGGVEMDVTFPKSPGHFEEWVAAIRGGEPAMSNFPDYAAPLAETVLLGNLAVWKADKINSTLGDEKAAEGEKIEWDAEHLEAKNDGDLQSLIRPTYRSGYTLDV
jgi:predicted dehydrogenase